MKKGEHIATLKNNINLSRDKIFHPNQDNEETDRHKGAKTSRLK